MKQVLLNTPLTPLLVKYCTPTILRKPSLLQKEKYCPPQILKNLLLSEVNYCPPPISENLSFSEGEEGKD